MGVKQSEEKVMTLFKNLYSCVQVIKRDYVVQSCKLYPKILGVERKLGKKVKSIKTTVRDLM